MACTVAFLKLDWKFPHIHDSLNQSPFSKEVYHWNNVQGARKQSL